MNQDKQHRMKQFVEAWRRAGPELEALRRRELAAFDFAANWKAIDDLLDAGLQHTRPRTESGMVEMQRWFLKLARQQGLVPTTVREDRAGYRVEPKASSRKKRTLRRKSRTDPTTR